MQKNKKLLDEQLIRDNDGLDLSELKQRTQISQSILYQEEELRDLENLPPRLRTLHKHGGELTNYEEYPVALHTGDKGLEKLRAALLSN